ncbi:unnamed protein product [Adineta steineri]|uniref:VWFA domain-containing protein n=1 Tax=Adineta steineri TaxID=433720 RepID=A0A815RS48_9BILA|nr:unnamed protein product [Adineta steineri]CAF1481921.1 unnamed protein product [Adineta steineri]
MTSSLHITKPDRPELAKHDASILDLVFAMDCTGSMASYIQSARDNIRAIVEEIVVSEKSDVRLALVEYRDHPPQEATFVTRVHDFTSKVNEMKRWLEQCQAHGGGDGPEAVADALHDVLKLSWRIQSTKIAILISDAPPHGLDPVGDGFPNGCPAGLDPLQIVRDMAQKHITLYTVGVEPPIMPYRDFFMSLAYITGGQYVPMINAKLLAKVIIGGVREEISLDHLMQNAQEDIDREMKKAEAEGVDEKEKAKRIAHLFASKNMYVQQMANVAGAHSTLAKESYSKCTNMFQMQQQFQAQQPPPSMYYQQAVAPSFIRPPVPLSYIQQAPPPPFVQHPLTGASYQRMQPPPYAQPPLPGASYQQMQPLAYSAISTDVKTDEMNYDLLANQEVSEEQAARIVQKWQNRT